MDEEKKKRLIEELEENDSFLTKYRHYQRIDKKKAWLDFCKRIDVKPKAKIHWQLVYKYAAILLLPISIIALYLLLFTKPTVSENSLAKVLPGKSQAILILSDGNKIALDSTTANCVVVNDSTTATVSNNRISYNGAKQNTSQQYNTLITKRAGEYQIVLDDGTKVHLNAASQLKYPVAFPGSERTVYLQGEAYFEIAPDKKRPFYVITNGMKVRQYGTQFNINAYPGELAEVVLVKGSIGVLTGEKEQMLLPGQLAEFDTENHQLTIKEVDVESYIAWNQGRFFFDNKTLKEIMDILSRWYDVDIQFVNNEVQQLHFTGSLDRYSTIEPIIQAISSAANVTVEMKNHILYISK